MWNWVKAASPNLLLDLQWEPILFSNIDIWYALQENSVWWFFQFLIVVDVLVLDPLSVSIFVLNRSFYISDKTEVIQNTRNNKNDMQLQRKSKKEFREKFFPGNGKGRFKLYGVLTSLSVMCTSYSYKILFEIGMSRIRCKQWIVIFWWCLS